jgi:AcrR family transcriptional regulator
MEQLETTLAYDAPIVKKAYHHGSLRETVLELSKKLIQEKGIHDFSLREVARMAGVSRTAPYRHFPDREAVLLAIAEEAYSKVSEEMQVVVQRSGDKAIIAVQELIVIYVKFMVENRHYFDFIFGSFIRDKISRQRLNIAREKMTNTITEMVKRARLVKGDSAQQQKIMAAGTWALMHGVASLICDDLLSAEVYTPDKLEYFARQCAQTFIKGLVN